MGTTKATLIPQNFRETCHPQLMGANINSQQNSLELHLLSQQEYQQWKWNLYPIKSCSKYLMQPYYFRQQNIGFGYCKPRYTHNIIDFNITIGYEPYIYTLHNEIMSRKYNNNFFTQKQIWKILKVTTISLKYWINVYEELSIGKISPQNIIFDLNGHIKVVNLFSFLPDSIIIINGKSHSYFEINPMNTLNTNTPTKQQRKNNITCSLYEIGITLISMLLLKNIDQVDLYNINNYFNNLSQVSQNIKSIVIWLVNCQAKSDKQLDQVIQIALNNKKL